jgi:Tfp pilus assembly protein PilO
MNKMRQWSMLTGLVVVVVFAAGWYLAVSPQRHHAAELRSQSATQQAANAQLLGEINQLKQQKQGLPAQQRLLDRIAAQVPDNPALPALIRDLSTAANAAGVDLESMAPATPAPVAPTATAGSVAPSTAAAGAASSTTAGATGSLPLDQISIVLKVKGSYYNVESFFAAVEKMKRAMRVTQWTIAPATSAGTPAAAASVSGSADTAKQLPPDTMEASLTALVYESPQLAQPTQVAPVAAAATSK